MNQSANQWARSTHHQFVTHPNPEMAQEETREIETSSV
jgi:hypothetical protein